MKHSENSAQVKQLLGDTVVINSIIRESGFEGIFRGVYRGTMDKQPVVLKGVNVTHYQEGMSQEIDLFKKEARALERASHPHIVRLHNAGFLQAHPPSQGQGFYYMVLEDGGTTAQDKMRNGGFSYDELVLMTDRVASGIEYLHYRGIAHRDIKPENILIGERGIVRITDLGFAAEIGNEQEWSQANMTPHYAAPEQLLGQKIDDPLATELYALGVTIFELTTGKLPYDLGNDPALMLIRLIEAKQQHPIPLRELSPDAPEELADVVEACLHPDPSERPIVEDIRRHLVHHIVARALLQ